MRAHASLLMTVVVAAAVGAAMTYFILLDGINMSPDSWAYWQGSVSLVEGQGYRLFTGQLIVSWPPLYSAYLAVWQLALGVSGEAIIIANVALVPIAVLGWIRLFGSTATMDLVGLTSTMRWLGFLGISGFITLYLPYHMSWLLSENLRNALLPFFLAATYEVWSEDDYSTKKALTAAVVGALLLLTHNSAVVFVIASCVLLLTSKSTASAKVRHVAIIGAGSVLPWVLVRLTLGQNASHPIGWGVAAFSPTEYAAQAFSSLVWLVGPPHLRLNLFLFVFLMAILISSFLPKRAQAWFGADPLSSGKIRFLFIWCVFSVGGLYLLFNLTWIHDPLAGRFLSFLPLVLVPAGMLLALRHRMRAIPLAFMVAALAAPTLRATQAMAGHRPANPEVDPGAVVLPNYAISPTYVDLPPTSSGDVLLVSPPRFE